MRLQRLLVLLFLVVPFLGPVRTAPADESVFAERFTSAEPTDRWTIRTTLDRPSLHWFRDGERPGFHVRSVAVDRYIKSEASAWAPWKVGTRPFRLSWDVFMKEGLKQRWFLPGLAVGLSSAPPGDMEPDDVVVSLGVHMGGILGSVRQGGFYTTSESQTGFRDRVRSDLVTDGGGWSPSVKWPMKHVDEQRLKFEIRRTRTHTIKFIVHWPSLPGNRGTPFWTGSWRLPEKIADVPLRYVTIKRVPVKKTHVSYSGFVMEGVVHHLQGRVIGESEPPPVPRSFTQEQPVLRSGRTITIHGKQFVRDTRVEVGGKPARSMEFVSSEELKVTLPEHPMQASYPLTVINPNGLAAELDEQVPYGRMLRDVRPREVLPEPERPVTVTGAGFEEDTVFQIGSKTAEIIDLRGPEQARISVPHGSKGRVKVTAHTGDHTFAGEPLFGYAPHPYLFFDRADRSSLQKRFRSEHYTPYRKRILTAAKQQLERKVPDGHGPNVGAITILAWAYVLTDRERYRKKVMEWIQRGFTDVRYSEFNQMGVGAMAIAYDLLFRDLTPEQKVAFEDYLDRMRRGYLKDARGGAWFLGIGDRNFSNTVPVGNSGGMLAGLSLMHSTPESDQAIDHAVENARLYSDQCITVDGGCQEGVQYWDYGMSFYLIMAHALKKATGDGRGLLDHPHLRKNVRFVESMLGGHGGLFAFNDSREPWLTGFAIAADLGSRYDQPLMRWVADRIARGGRNIRTRKYYLPYAFLWRDQTPSPETFPGVPTLSYLKSMHWGAMRSGSSFMPDLVVGVKGGRTPHTHHTQKDVGSYVVHANGESYLIDPGYYEGKPRDHTLPIVAGQGPGTDGARITEARETDDWRQMTLDSTEAYGKAVRRVKRIITMYKSDHVVVLDDIRSADETPGEVTTRFQTAMKPEVLKSADRNGFTIPGTNGTLIVRTFGYPLDFSVKNMSFGNENWHWTKLDKSGPKNWHAAAGTYQVKPGRPLVTVLTPSAPGENPPEPQFHYEENRVRVTFPEGPEFVFTRSEGGWTFEMPDERSQ